MVVELITTDINGLAEQYEKQDDSIILRYKAYAPKNSKNGTVEFRSKEVDSIRIFGE